MLPLYLNLFPFFLPSTVSMASFCNGVGRSECVSNQSDTSQIQIRLTEAGSESLLEGEVNILKCFINRRVCPSQSTERTARTHNGLC
uniref:Putative secreted protein n=1 Tax=Anopheles darlingi TaxID=43151 RepID=A0A2M4DNV4_ANODA